MDHETNIINTIFIPPISFSQNVKILKNKLVTDLELNKLISNEEKQEGQEKQEGKEEQEGQEGKELYIYLDHHLKLRNIV